MGAIRRLGAAGVGAVSGLGVTFAGVYAYALLARANLRCCPSVPWGPLSMIPLLWWYWRWLGGAGWPRSTSAYRHGMRRGTSLAAGAGRMVLAAGIAGFTLAASAIVLGFRLADLPADAFALPTAPIWTLIPAVIMLSLVAAVSEEVGIRGYLQKSLEETGFRVAAVACSATAFVLLHGNRQWFAAQSIPMFITALWYGYYTLRTDAIYPMIVIHASLDLAAFTTFGLLGAPPPVSIRQAGLTAAFWLNLALGGLALIAALVLTARIPARELSPDGSGGLGSPATVEGGSA